MNPQQMAMELRVLRTEKLRLLQTLDQMRAQAEKEKSIELFLAHAIAGYASQPRAAEEVFFQRDNGTGVLSPLDGGPKWVAEQALKTMNHIVSELEGMVRASEPEPAGEESKEPNDGEAPDDGAEPVSEVQGGEAVLQPDHAADGAVSGIISCT